MLETSKDILYITLSLSVAVFTGFLVWIMYYVAQISRQSNEMVTDFREKLAELDAAVSDLRERLTNVVDTLSDLGETVGNIAGVVSAVSGKAKKAATSRSRKKK